MKYKVTIKEVLKKSVIIEAADAYDAEFEAQRMYESGEVILTSDDYEGKAEFSAEPAE